MAVASASMSLSIFDRTLPAPLALRMVTPSPRIRKRWGGAGGAKVKHVLSGLHHVTMACFKTNIPKIPTL